MSTKAFVAFYSLLAFLLVWFIGDAMLSSMAEETGRCMYGHITFVIGVYIAYLIYNSQRDKYKEGKEDSKKNKDNNREETNS